MTKEDLYRIWAPESLPWSPWVKPVLFAFADAAPLPMESAAGFDLNLEWLGSGSQAVALVIDLPGEQSVRAGVALSARFGFQPVPLFTSCPPPSAGIQPFVLTAEILRELRAGAPILAERRVVPAVSPTFLLDSNRHSPSRQPTPNTFDNRSAVFATDFPSAARLRAHGVERVIVVRDPAHEALSDLGYALTPWVRDGLKVEVVGLSGERIAFAWPPRGFWSALWHRISLLLALKRNSSGGFGGFVPEASGG